MPRLKRTFDEAELDGAALEGTLPAEHVETLTKLRNMWQFASLMQYIYLFGHVVKIDNDFDIEDLESECLGPQPSEKLARIGLQLLKYVSSHRGLTPDIFDEYTRRQYVAKAPLRNPYGEEEEPAKFSDFDVSTKVKVLQQLTTWTLGNADRIRSMMPQEEDHLAWRIEPIGWDKEDRAYFVLDDDRLYRRTDEPVRPPTPPPKSKAKSKSIKKSKPRGTRTSKRRKIEETSEEEADDVEEETGAQEDTVMTNGDHALPEVESGFGFTSKTWECIAITLEEYQDFLATIFRTRDPNEKQLRRTIEENILPVIERRAESQRQKQMKKLREFENLQKLATAKRSSRLADKAEKDKADREEREAEEKKQRDLKMAHEEQERQRRIEEGHESRRLTREQRLKEREVKRILHEEELAKLEEAASRAESQDPSSDAATADANKRMSERQLKTQRERHQQELQRMAEEEDNWVFDCAMCGVHGENLDDGTHSIACERCNVWQHSKCHGFSPKHAEKDGFHFVCSTCKRKEADAKKPKIPPLKLGSAKKKSPEVQILKPAGRPEMNGRREGGALPAHIARQLDAPQYYYPPGSMPGPFGQITNGQNSSPYGQPQGPPGYRYPPVGNFAPHQPPPPQQPWQGSPNLPPGRPSSSGYATSPQPPMANGYGSPNQHQQQHQYLHQNAVAASGGHPAYQVPYQPQHQPQHQPQVYTYSRGAPGGMYPTSSSPPPQHHQYHQSPYSDPQRSPYQQAPPPPSHQPQQQQQPGNAQMMSGAQSPVKNAPNPATSPSQYDFHRQPPPPRQPNQHLSRSPSTHFPPLANTYAQRAAHSPVKSSPPPPPLQQYYQPSHQQGPPKPPPHLAQTPQTFRPPSSNGIPFNHHTPQTQDPHPSPASANANAVAADGMSGPWPAGSKTIPQKHDQSPALPPPPPSSSQKAGETRPVPSAALPPVALAPSPQGQQQVDMRAVPAGGQSVPVKKMVEVNGASVLAAQAVSGAVSGPAAPQMQPAPILPKEEQANGADLQSMQKTEQSAPSAAVQTQQ